MVTPSSSFPVKQTNISINDDKKLSSQELSELVDSVAKDVIKEAPLYACNVCQKSWCMMDNYPFLRSYLSSELPPASEFGIPIEKYLDIYWHQLGLERDRPLTEKEKVYNYAYFIYKLTV
jgi:hypothetical protein